jgi:hypothetical protein
MDESKLTSKVTCEISDKKIMKLERDLNKTREDVKESRKEI